MKALRIAVLVAATVVMGCSQSPTGPTTAARPTISYDCNTSQNSSNNPPVTASGGCNNNNNNNTTNNSNNPPNTAGN